MEISATERLPLLHGLEFTKMCIDAHPSGEWHTSVDGYETGRKVRDFYEAKITSGELMVVPNHAKDCGYWLLVIDTLPEQYAGKCTCGLDEAIARLRGQDY